MLTVRGQFKIITPPVPDKLRIPPICTVRIFKNYIISYYRLKRPIYEYFILSRLIIVFGLARLALKIDF